MAAIEEQRFLDYLIVCSCNPEPYPKLWKHLAIADAARLHCFVIIANWSKEKDTNGFGLGSACISPTRKIEHLEDEPRVQKLNLPVPNETVEGSLLFHELDLAALFRDREKPKNGFLSPPHRRRNINKKAGH
jgi:predicted amidohydrolase